MAKTRTVQRSKTSVTRRLRQQKAVNKVAYAKKKSDLKLQRMEAKNHAKIQNTQLKATIKTQRAAKKYNFDPSLTNEQKTKLRIESMKHDTARIAATEAAGSVTSLAGGLGGASISMQQAHFGRENEPTVPNPPSTTQKPSGSGNNVGSSSSSNPTLDDILGAIG